MIFSLITLLNYPNLPTMNRPQPSTTPSSLTQTDVEKGDFEEPGANSDTNLNHKHDEDEVPVSAQKVERTATINDTLVDFDGPSDPYRPLNWSTRKKIVNTVLYSFCTMGSTWASTM